MKIMRNNSNSDDVILIVFYSRKCQGTNFGYKFVTEAVAQGVKLGNTIWDYEYDFECDGNLLPNFQGVSGTRTIDDVIYEACFNKLLELNPQKFGNYSIEEI